MIKHTISEQMTKSLVTITDSDTLDHAYTLMFNNKIRHLIVKGPHGDVVGILSDRDIQRAMDSNISESFGFKLESVKFKAGTRVCDYMSTPVKTFGTDTDLKLVLQKMIDEKVSAFLIVDVGSKNVVGIVTTDDFLHLLLKLLQQTDEEESYILGDIFSNPIFGRMGQAVSDLGI